MRKRSTGLWVLLVIMAAALAFATFEIDSVSPHLQYMTAAPKPAESSEPEPTPTPSDDDDIDVSTYDDEADDEDDVTPSTTSSSTTTQQPNSEIKALLESLKDAADEWTMVIDQWTLFGVQANAPISVGDEASTESMNARLWLVTDGWQTLEPVYLREGRYFYDEELMKGEKVAIIDEQIALKLFHVSDARDRVLEWNGLSYRVVGVTRHTRRVGDENDAGFYVPLSSIYGESVTLDALLVDTLPVSGSGAETMFTTAMAQWRSGGTVINLAQEKMGAGLPVRVLLFLVGMGIVLRLIGLMNRAVIRFHEVWKRKMRTSYATKLLPWAIARVLLLAAGYILCAMGAAWMMDFIIQPVYTFPDWIPSVLIEWDEIGKAFWNVWQKQSTLVQWRTPAFNRLRFFSMLNSWLSFGCGLVLVRLLSRYRSREEKLTDGIPAMAESGAVSAAVMVSPEMEDAYRQLGYIRPSGQEAMVRVLNAEQLLKTMPASAKDGSFVLAVEDPLIEDNNGTWRLTCEQGHLEVKRISRDYDLKLPIGTLAEIVYGDIQFNSYLESHIDFDLKLRSAAMEGYFSHRLKLSV